MKKASNTIQAGLTGLLTDAGQGIGQAVALHPAEAFAVVFPASRDADDIAGKMPFVDGGPG